LQVAFDQDNALCRQGPGLIRASDQGAYAKALCQQRGTRAGADKTCGAGYGDQVITRYQAEATLRRNSSVTALRRSGSWAAMKSRRALARDNLPDDVFGRE
jgi:hypothetical protein